MCLYTQKGSIKVHEIGREIEEDEWSWEGI